MASSTNRVSTLKNLYMMQNNKKQSNSDLNIHNSTVDERTNAPSLSRDSHEDIINSTKSDDDQWDEQYAPNRTNKEKRVGSGLLSCANLKTCLIGLVISLLLGSIALAVVITMQFTPTSTTTIPSTTSVTTSTSTSTTTTTSVTTSTSTSTTSVTTSTSTSTTSVTTSTSTSTTSDTTSTSTTSASTTTDTTTVNNIFTPSTVTCSSTVATPCTTTTTLVATCQSYEVSWNNHCFYLDGSGGNCTTGYSRATNAVLTCIATGFANKTYRSTISNNCCVWTSDTYECYYMSTQCNAAGPFTTGPAYGCTNAQQHYGQQMTLCGSD